MNVLPADKILYSCILRSRDISYDTQQKHLKRQSNRGKWKPDIPHRQNSLQTNHKVNTPNVQAKLQVSREMSRDTSSRQLSPPALTVVSDRVNLSP